MSDRGKAEFAVMDMTHNSALAMSGIVACEYIPALLVGLWAGVFVDRIDRRFGRLVCHHRQVESFLANAQIKINQGCTR